MHCAQCTSSELHYDHIVQCIGSQTSVEEKIRRKKKARDTVTAPKCINVMNSERDRFVRLSALHYSEYRSSVWSFISVFIVLLLCAIFFHHVITCDFFYFSFFPIYLFLLFFFYIFWLRFFFVDFRGWECKQLLKKIMMKYAWATTKLCTRKKRSKVRVLDRSATSYKLNSFLFWSPVNGY